MEVSGWADLCCAVLCRAGLILGPEHFLRMPTSLKSLLLRRWGYPEDPDWVLDLSHLTALTELDTRCSWDTNEVVFPPNLQVLHDRVEQFRFLEPLTSLRKVSSCLPLELALQLAGVATGLTNIKIILPVRGLEYPSSHEDDSSSGSGDADVEESSGEGDDGDAEDSSSGVEDGAVDAEDSSGGEPGSTDGGEDVEDGPSLGEGLVDVEPGVSSLCGGMQGHIDSIFEAGVMHAVRGVWVSLQGGRLLIDAAVLVQLTRLPSLEFLRLAMVELSAESAAVLGCLTGLTRLDMYMCYIENEVLLQLPRVLAKLPSLQLLELPINMEERLMSELSEAERHGLLRGLAGLRQLRVLELQRFRDTEGQAEITALLADLAPELRVEWVNS